MGFGNGGNLATLMNFLQMRGMLRAESGAWEHLLTIQVDLLKPEYKREHYYFDLYFGGQLHFDDRRRGREARNNDAAQGVNRLLKRRFY